MHQRKIDEIFIESLKSSKSKEETIYNAIGYLLFSSVNLTYNITKNIFNRYIEEPRKELKILTEQNEMMIKNQSELLKLLKNKK